MPEGAADAQVTGALRQALDWVGLRLPDGDPIELYRRGNVWLTFAEAARGQATAAEVASRRVWQENVGDSVDAFRGWWTGSGGPRANLLRAAVGAEQTGSALHALAAEVAILQAAFVAGLTLLVTALGAAGLLAVGTGGALGVVVGAASAWLIAIVRRRLLRSVDKAVTVVVGMIVGQLLRNAAEQFVPVPWADPVPGTRSLAMRLPEATDDDLLDAVVDAVEAEGGDADTEGWEIVDSNGPHSMKNPDEIGLPQTPKEDQERYHVIVRDHKNGGDTHWSLNRDSVTGQWGTIKRSSYNYD